MGKLINISHSLYIERSPAEVWDFTQDYSKRIMWDRSIRSAKVLSADPRRIAITGEWGFEAEFLYKLDKRPERTSLAMHEVNSPFISGGGGSWVYEQRSGGCLWTQTNTLILKKGYLINLMRPIIALVMKISMNKSMRRARDMMEEK